MVALSFASDAEANMFYKTVTATIVNRSKKRRSRKLSSSKTDGSQDMGYGSQDTAYSGVVLRNQNNSTGKQMRNLIWSYIIHLQTTKLCLLIK